MLAHGDSGLIHAGSLHHREVSLGEIAVKIASWDDGTTANRRESNAAALYRTAEGTLDDGRLAMTGMDEMADVVSFFTVPLAVPG